MKLAWDADRCQGHGRCYALAAEVIGCDDNGYPVVPATDLDEGALADVQVAVENCPEQALRLTSE